MIRILLVVFFIGLVVCVGASAVSAALGGPHHHAWGSNFAGHRWMRDADNDDDADNGAATRDVAWANPGNRLQIDVPADVHYTQGPQAHISAQGSQRLIDDLQVVGDSITFKHRHQWRHGGHLVLTITAPSVRQFELNGAQTFDIANYAQDNLDLKVNGAAQVTAAGTAKTLHLALNGAAQGNLGRLVNQTADVEINGAGDATLATTDAATIAINGVGHARLLNTPKTLTKHISGFGSVETGVRDDDDDGDKPQAAPVAPAPPVLPTPAAKNHHAKATAA